jgi:hypothetical protein
MVSWIFQGNPNVFDIDGYLRERNDISWLVRQEHFMEDIMRDDIVYMWRADGIRKKSGGVVAKGCITSTPGPFEDDAPELWKQRKEESSPVGVRIELEDVRLNPSDGMLLRVDLEKDEILKDMLILRMRALTNYKMEPRHADRIEYLWKRNKK